MQRFLSRFIGLAIVCTFIAGADSCSSTSNNPGPTFVTDLTLKDATGAVTRDFDRGEPVTFELSVRNRTSNEAILQFSSGYQSDFMVVDAVTSPAAPIRWLWSNTRSFLQATTEVEFAPGETRIITVIWDQRDSAGLQFNPGSYEARGVMVFGDFPADLLAEHQLGSPLRPFTIR